MRRRLLLLLAAVLAGALLIVAAVPWWLGSVARSLGRDRGLTFAAYERLGYGRFALRDVVFQRENVRVAIGRIESDTPVLWAWRQWRGRGAEIVVRTWSVEVARPTAATAPAPGKRGWLPLRARLLRIAGQLERWLPQARVGEGAVRFPGGEISLDGARWSGRKLTTRGLAYRALKLDATVELDSASDRLRLTAEGVAAAGWPLRVQAESSGAVVQGDVAVLDQPATLRAGFADAGWLPREVSIMAANWIVPAERLKLEQGYARVLGSARIAWQADRFAAEVDARSEPRAETAAPPLRVTLRGAGDLTAFTLTELSLMLPGIEGRIDEPVTFDRGRGFRESAARFTLSADLSQQRWFEAAGTVRGEAHVVRRGGGAPAVEFSLQAKQVRARELALAAVDARGELAWPRLSVTTATIVAEGGERLTAQGAWDFRARQLLGASFAGELRRASLARWLPAQPEFATVRIEAQAEGPVAALAHRGAARIDGLQVSGLTPLAVRAEWKGTGVAVESAVLTASAGNSVLTVAGALTREAARLTHLEFKQGETVRLALVEPATIQWRPQVRLEALQLGTDTTSASASAILGESGRIDLALREIDSRWLADFVPQLGPPWRLSLLALQSAWDRGPMRFAVSAAANLEIAEGRHATVALTARGDRDGLFVDALRATEGDVAAVSATGRLPVTFSPASKRLLDIADDGALRLEATIAPHAAFWQQLATLSGIELLEPRASARLTGTWRRPEGEAFLKAAKIAIDPRRAARPLPTLEALEVKMVGDHGGVTLETLAVAVEGQPVRAKGRLPVPEGKWMDLFKQPLAVARRGADLRLEIPDAEVAVFARFLPAVLAPKGRFQADLRYREGGVEGFVTLRDAASRPLGPLGVLQEISADVALAGRKLALRGVTARSGGQPVTLTGTVELREGGAPSYDLALSGENLPFVRQTGLLLRGDLDLKLQTPANAPPRLSGTVRLRDSLFLSDVRAFLPRNGGSSPTRRPPYFAVETAPVDGWGLAVDVVGDEFLQLRTPVFSGVASARFRLGGTLGEPRAIGEATVARGAVRMPFANFQVTQGAVRLTEADPFEPEVYLRATGRRYGYDLAMEIEGNASRPNVVFNSSPALDSEQLFLMVMTGAASSNEITNTAGQRSASVGIFLSQSLLDSLGFGDAADADRLSVTVGEKISRTGKETYDIEYKLNDRWTIVGERNEYDDKNAGLKWRLFGGKKRRETGDAKK